MSLILTSIMSEQVNDWSFSYDRTSKQLKHLIETRSRTTEITVFLSAKQYLFPCTVEYLGMWLAFHKAVDRFFHMYTTLVLQSVDATSVYRVQTKVSVPAKESVFEHTS